MKLVTKLFRSLENGKIYTKPLPVGEFYPLNGDMSLYKVDKMPKLGSHSKWVVRIVALTCKICKWNYNTVFRKSEPETCPDCIDQKKKATAQRMQTFGL